MQKSAGSLQIWLTTRLENSVCLQSNKKSGWLQAPVSQFWLAGMILSMEAVIVLPDV